MRLAVLLVGPNAPQLADALTGDARLETFAAETDGAARAYLSGTAFDRVVCLGPSDAAHLARSLGLDTSELDATADAHAVRAALSLAPPPTAATPAADLGDADQAAKRILALRDEINRVAHDLNNPVAIILGNAQLAAELGGADLDPTVRESLADIETAAGVLVTRVRALGALRATADAALDALGHSRQS